MHNGDSHRIITVERLLAGKHLVHHCAYRVYVALLIGNCAACLLRADVVNAADRLIRSRFSLFTSKLGNAEIHYLDSSVVEHHNILRLYVSVNYTLSVSVLEGAENLNDKVNRILPGEHLLLFDVLLQCNTVNIFHCDILELFGESHVVDLNNIRMRQNCHSFGFVTETAEELFIFRILLLQDLDSDGLIVDNVNALIDLSHPANADKLGNLISAVKLFANVLIHCFTLSSYFRIY